MENGIAEHDQIGASNVIRPVTIVLRKYTALVYTCKKKKKSNNANNEGLQSKKEF